MPRRRCTFRERCDRYPPILVRLLAVWGPRHSRYVPSDRDLAREGQMTMAEVKFIGYSTSWSAITDSQRTRYLAACHIDLENPRTFRRIEFMRRKGMFAHTGVTPATNVQKPDPLLTAQFEELLTIWKENLR